LLELRLRIKTEASYKANLSNEETVAKFATQQIRGFAQNDGNFWDSRVFQQGGTLRTAS